jgi:ligand-binding sensor domain-containing protein
MLLLFREPKILNILFVGFIFLGLMACSQRTVPTSSGDKPSPPASFSWITSDKPQTAAINKLIMSPDNHLYAATNGDGILRSTDGGENWEFYNNSLSDTVIQCLACDSAGNLFAGTLHQGLFVLPSGQSTWIQTDLTGKAIYSLGINPEGKIFAGSADTVYRSIDSGQTWESLPTDIIDKPVICFLFFPGGRIFAGTYARGIITSRDSGLSWSSNLISQITIISLGSNSLNHILAGTMAQGGLISADEGQSWNLLTNGFGESAYQFVINSQGYVFCSGIGDGIRRSLNNGEDWEGINANLSDLYVYSLVLNQQEYLLAGTETGLIFKSNYSSRQRELPGID